MGLVTAPGTLGTPARRRRHLPAPAPVLAASLLTASLLSCAGRANPLLGEWVSVGSEDTRMTYIFEDGGRARWILELSEGPDTFEVAYEARYGSAPIELDVGPWRSGPLAGQTLYGIVQLQGPDRFRVDFEPANPDGDGSERPATFSEQAVTFVRRVN